LRSFQLADRRDASEPIGWQQETEHRPGRFLRHRGFLSERFPARVENVLNVGRLAYSLRAILPDIPPGGLSEWTRTCYRKSVSTPLFRLSWVDTAKGLGIFLVVFGHCGRGLMSAGIAPTSGPLAETIRWIYTFHMPLFFWLSGLFVARRLAAPFPKFVIHVFRTVVYPYLLWASLQICVQSLFSHLTNEPASLSELTTILWQPSRQYWFLYVLALAQCVHWVLSRAFASSLLVFAASLILHVVVPLVLPPNWTPVLLIFHYLPWITGAAFLAPRLDQLAKIPSVWCWAASLACLSFIVLDIAPPPSETFVSPQGIVGVTGSVLLSVAVARKGTLGFLQTWGEASLEIYVAHTLASAGFRIALSQLGITNVTVHLIGGTLVGIVFPLALLHLARKADFPYLFTLRRRRGTSNHPE
jgi:fucose 4-O-acetylase-like acetyltransferase